MKLDLTGQRFGQLTVAFRATSNRNNRITMWHCICDCGQEKDVSTCHLRSGHTKSCGRCQTFIDEKTHMRCVLRDGKFFVFDKQDFDLIKGFSWSMSNGYARTWKKEYGYIKLHRLLLGANDMRFVDHINGKRWDNRRCNLRFADTTQNAQNQGLRKNNRSGYKGVYKHANGKYHARISVNKRHLSLGYYSDALQAARAYDSAAYFYFGEYARPNFCHD